MSKFVIEGGHPLKGEVTISGSKNAALPIMAATLLAPGKHVLHGVPIIGDVQTMMRILEVTGASVKIEGHTLIIDTVGVNNPFAPYELVSTMRASFLIAGALLGRLGEVCIARPGGCAIGPRSIDEHLRGFKALGVQIKEEHGYIHAKITQNSTLKQVASGDKVQGKPQIEICLNEQSVTATENILLASVIGEREIRIINVAREPHVMDLINFLNSIGARIKLKDNTIVVSGVTKLSPSEYTISPDYNEAGTFMVGSAITKGDVLLRGARWEDSVAEIIKLQEIGVDIEKTPDGIRVKMHNSPKPCNIKTAPYPGFPTELQPQISSLLALADGTSIVTEAMYEQRFTHVPELVRMGAQIEIEGRNAIINGVKELSGAKVMASDIRGGVALVLAGLAADGITEVSRIYHIDRGYEKLEVKLANLGAKIKRV